MLTWSVPYAKTPEVLVESDMSQQLKSTLGSNLVKLENARVLPYNLEAEQSLLGAILLNNSCFENVSEFLESKHFYSPIHGRIFGAAKVLIEQNLVADPITLRAYFEKSSELSSIGGGEYLVKLVDCVTSLNSSYDYGKLIYELYLRRELISIGDSIIYEANEFNIRDSAISQIEKAEEKLFSLANQGSTERGFIEFKTALAEAISVAAAARENINGLSGITTGLRDLDNDLGGLHKSDLIILAGRPSMGKTALATNIAYNAALASMLGKKEGAKVAFFSLEMSSEQLATRLIAQEAKIPSHRIRKGVIKADEFQRLVDVSRNLVKIPLFIDDTPALTTSALRTRARRLKRQHGLDLIIIDYLQLLQAHDTKNGRVQEISEITRSLKAIAKELDVPVIALSQLSRAVEQREDKRPQLADLRESGSIEQDADVVMFVFREEYYISRREPSLDSEKHKAWQSEMAAVYNVAEVILAKQRHGPIGTIKLFFDGNLTRFGNLVKD